MILTGLAVVGVLSLILSYALKISLVIFSLVSLLASIFVYATARSEMSEDEINTSFILLVVCMVFGVFGLVHHAIYISVYKSILGLSGGLDGDFTGMYENMAGSAFVLSGILNVGVLFAILIYVKDDKRKEQALSLKDISFESVKVEEEASVDVPDIVLCKDADTGKNVIWPHGDRYVHALILGPTGSGKTSQSIIPMIFQDMQKKNVGITVLEPKGNKAA